jgi:hypothetical protein
MKTNIYKILFTVLIAAGISSCKKNLDLVPTNDITSEAVYKTAEGYKQAFAKVYGSYATTGNNGGAGNGDIQGIDEGTSDFLRLFWQAQELSTDEAVIAWGDAGIRDLHNLNWSSSNPFLRGLYLRSMYQITLSNEFIRQSADDKVSARGISGTDATNISGYRAEARFLRAFQYWVMMDLFGNPPFVTETDLFGGPLPKQIQRKDLFNYIETELKAIEAVLPAAKSNEYGRADKGAVWALLARLYLNAKVYTGTDRFTDAITYSKKVIDAGYTLTPDYRHLMLADNHLNKNEFILTINYDGQRTQSFGGATFLTHAAVGGSMPPANFGVSGGWFGLRTTKNLPNLFPDYTGTADKRSQFYQTGQNLEINDISAFTDGLAVTKIRNVTRSGTQGQNGDFADVDFPLFRLAEMYLVYAESVLRGGTGGDLSTAVQYINNLRIRAYGNTSGNVTTITLPFILDERGRELYWEGHRRTDLIRYDLFTTDTYLWPFKGGVKNGKAVEAYRNLYPIPFEEINGNPNLTQNPGY